ncbi:MAG: nitroreductase family deazaflavin-dependent oxidoreductase [Actinomycetia bacterium]|nr:nitroreductase family deazaflavin-dependent oxidoreductase [Actinomycetes bacterium]
MKVMTKANNWTYRATKGRVGGRLPGGAPICLLTTTGRKSGKARTVALLYMLDGDEIVVVASKGGMPTHPDWYLNVEANPQVEIELGDDKGRYLAHTANAERKAKLWPRLVEMYSSYDDYQDRTDREIPVVVCTPS